MKLAMAQMQMSTDMQQNVAKSVQFIEEAAAKGADLIFFPGHVAVYIGGGRYIHATAWRKTPRVTINSLNPEAPDYRRDLAESISAFGSLFRS